ncbi:MAG: glutaredoxin family protein [Cyanobium sp. PLM2.Bin73]|jgi:thioredoxin-like negative regulator of GroEL|nr:MAG: glutaredoxin family protein [Cyanobium sp. PLM2.Bin73]
MDAPLPPLLLYSRQGCCLCEGLEQKLRALVPAPSLTVVDVDDDPALQARFGLEVPVLLLLNEGGAPRQLPRVPPRLQGAQLRHWLTRHAVEPPRA